MKQHPVDVFNPEECDLPPGMEVLEVAVDREVLSRSEAAHGDIGTAVVVLVNYGGKLVYQHGLTASYGETVFMQDKECFAIPVGCRDIPSLPSWSSENYH